MRLLIRMLQILRLPRKHLSLPQAAKNFLRIPRTYMNKLLLQAPYGTAIQLNTVGHQF